MLHMSVSGVAKLHICSMYWQLVSVDNGKSIDFLPTVNFKGHVSKMLYPINSLIIKRDRSLVFYRQHVNF